MRNFDSTSHVQSFVDLDWGLAKFKNEGHEGDALCEAGMSNVPDAQTVVSEVVGEWRYPIMM